ncbi:MAG: translation initiation factor IF-2 N-terminal domain-containing protein, partial [Crocosphaera sp.]
MNNAHKVRIYDLSKELNLENKDILEICGQLNIAVKSHSSTITESDAERIKGMVDKYLAQQGTPHPRDEEASGDKKQQILAIHRKQVRPRPASKTPDSPSANLMSPRPPAPPKPPVPQTPPQKPTPPTVAKPPQVTPPAPAQPPTAPEKTPKQPEPASASLLEPPQRLKPPVKTTPELAQKPITKPTKNKPSLEGKNKVKPAKKVAKNSPPKPKDKSQKPSISKPEGATDSPTPSKNIKKPQTNKRELKHPVPPQEEAEKIPTLVAPSVKPASEIIEEADENDDSIETLLKPKPQLKRPAPPRIAQRESGEGGEGGQESMAKCNKGSGEASRR